MVKGTMVKKTITFVIRADNEAFSCEALHGAYAGR